MNNVMKLMRKCPRDAGVAVMPLDISTLRPWMGAATKKLRDYFGDEVFSTAQAAQIIGRNKSVAADIAAALVAAGMLRRVHHGQYSFGDAPIAEKARIREPAPATEPEIIAAPTPPQYPRALKHHDFVQRLEAKKRMRDAAVAAINSDLDEPSTSRRMGGR